MSLTSHLNDPRSPVLAFMRERFPNTASFVRPVNRELKDAATISPPERQGYPLGLVGAAADYRIRFYFPQTTLGSEGLAARAGAMLLGQGATHPSAPSAEDFDRMLRRMHGVARATGELFRTLEGFLSRVRPTGRALPADEEERLSRYCFVLACLDQVYRAGAHPANPLFSETATTAHALLALAPKDAVDDLGQISHVFYECQRGLISEDARLGPTFAGSRDVGGADADLLVGGRLIDVKTLATPKITGKMLHQLLGYTLLDYDDEYSIRRVGLYLSRQGTLLSWDLGELLLDLSPVTPEEPGAPPSPTSLPDLRYALRYAANS